MAKQDFIKFYSEYLPQNPELKAKVDAIANEQEFAKTVLDLGPKAGFSFSQDDVESVMKASEAVVLGKELSDDQLDAVAGGAAVVQQNVVQISGISLQNLSARLDIGGKAASTIMCCW